jgi:hypothetical protein
MTAAGRGRAGCAGRCSRASALQLVEVFASYGDERFDADGVVEADDHIHARERAALEDACGQRLGRALVLAGLGAERREGGAPRGDVRVVRRPCEPARAEMLLGGVQQGRAVPPRWSRDRPACSPPGAPTALLDCLNAALAARPAARRAASRWPPRRRLAVQRWTRVWRPPSGRRGLASLLIITARELQGSSRRAGSLRLSGSR